MVQKMSKIKSNMINIIWYNIKSYVNSNLKVNAKQIE